MMKVVLDANDALVKKRRMISLEQISGGEEWIEF